MRHTLGHITQLVRDCDEAIAFFSKRLGFAWDDVAHAPTVDDPIGGSGGQREHALAPAGGARPMSTGRTRWPQASLAAATLGLWLSPVPRLTAQDERIVVGPRIAIPAADPGRPIVEPHLAVHPHDRNRMIAAAIVVDSATKDVWIGSHIDVFVTADGGNRWRQRRLDMTAGADPWLAIDAQGRAFLAYLGQQSASGRSELLYRISTDGGATWTAARSLGPGHDRETMVSGTVGGRHATFLFSSLLRLTSKESGLAHVYLARSLDGGEFEELTSFQPSNLQTNTLNAVVTRDGALVGSFMDYATPQFRMLGTRRAWVLVSRDLGATLSEPRFVADDLAPRSYVVIAADPTDRFAASRLYALRLVSLADSSVAVRLSLSDDHGQSWAADVTVADAVGGARPAGPANVIVDERGVVGAAWFDRRQGASASSVDLYFTASTDGGATFTPAQRITESTSMNATEGNGLVARRFQQGGDYFGLAALPGGGFQLLWSDSRTGIYQLYTVRIRVTDGP